MIEKIIRDYLLTVLSVPVYIEVPPNPPDSYVEIERTGGGVDEHIRNAQVVVACYGPTMLEAATLQERVLETLPNIATGEKVSACYVNSEYNATDTTTKRYRFEAYFNIVYY